MNNFYPSINVEVAAEEVKLEVIELLAEVEGVHCTMSKEDVDRDGLQHVVHRRKKKKGSRPGRTCKAGRAKDDSWLPPLLVQPAGKREEWSAVS